jgi:hypothetical protein
MLEMCRALPVEINADRFWSKSGRNAYKQMIIYVAVAFVSACSLAASLTKTKTFFF